MLTLIKREIEDNFTYYILAVLLNAIAISVKLSIFFKAETRKEASIVFPGIFIVFFSSACMCGMGVSQMYLDKNRKISSFLLTYPVNRNMIIAARIISGIIAAVLFVLPSALVLDYFSDSVFTSGLSGFITEQVRNYMRIASFVTFLSALSAYSIGLLTGWSDNKYTPTLGGLGLLLIFLLLIPLKGFGVEYIIVSSIFIVCAFFAVFYKFNRTAL